MKGIGNESGVVTTALFLFYFCVLKDDCLIRAGEVGSGVMEFGRVERSALGVFLKGMRFYL